MEYRSWAPAFPFLPFGLPPTSSLLLLFCSSFLVHIVFLPFPVGEGMITRSAATCLPNQSLALLQFKHTLSLDSQEAGLKTWQNGSDCCTWKGVSCNNRTGFVTRLDLIVFDLQASEIPLSLFELHRLRYLDLSGNSFSGSIPWRLSELTDLNYLGLQDCNLCGPIPPGLLNHPTLQYLDLSLNNLNGSLPDFGNRFSKLSIVDLSNNMLDGVIPSSIKNFAHLELLHLGGNKFSGVVHLSLFQNLRNLTSLCLSDNNKLTVKLPKAVDLDQQGAIFSSMQVLKLRSCNMEGEFVSGKTWAQVWVPPKHQMLPLEAVNSSGWKKNSLLKKHSTRDAILTALICNMFLLEVLQVSGNNLTGTIPDCLTNLTRLWWLDLSRNNLTGTIPDYVANITKLSWLDLSNNQFHGQIPKALDICAPHFFLLALSNNQLTGEITILTKDCNSGLQILDLSHNLLTGRLPDDLLAKFDQLMILDLSSNQLHGSIPNARLNVSGEKLLSVLNLNDNKLVGRIPSSLCNCSQLEVIDLGRNKLSDAFPFWIGHLYHLQILALDSNKLYGSIESPFSKLVFSSLQVLDLSSNQLTGRLPRLLFQNSSFMMGNQSNAPLSQYLVYLDNFAQGLWLAIKGRKQFWTKSVRYLTSIDLSNNHFVGKIPEEIGALLGLCSLNLSKNNLDGCIPRSLGRLQHLESLDLSHNHLSGNIPEELTRDTFLSVLDLSYNTLEGRIPQGSQLGTFNVTSFQGNPRLCGSPLAISCPGSSSTSQDYIKGAGEMTGHPHWEYFVQGIGFAMGLLTFTLPVMFIERVGSWYWHHVDNVLSLHLKLHSRRLQVAARLSFVWCSPFNLVSLLWNISNW